MADEKVLKDEEMEQVSGGVKHDPISFPLEPTRFPRPGIDLEKLLESLTEEELEAMKTDRTELSGDLARLEELLKKKFQQ